MQELRRKRGSLGAAVVSKGLREIANSLNFSLTLSFSLSPYSLLLFFFETLSLSVQSARVAGGGKVFSPNPPHNWLSVATPLSFSTYRPYNFPSPVHHTLTYFCATMNRADVAVG